MKGELEQILISILITVATQVVVRCVTRSVTDRKSENYFKEVFAMTNTNGICESATINTIISHIIKRRKKKNLLKTIHLIANDSVMLRAFIGLASAELLTHLNAAIHEEQKTFASISPIKYDG